LAEIPEKPYYKVGEVCKYTDTQPYVLRFWESEFPQLAARKDRGGQRVYSRDDLEVVMRIKQLLYEQEYTIADARRLLETETVNQASRSVSPAILEPGDPAIDTDEPILRESAPDPASAAHADSYRASYEAARDEVERLRGLLGAAEQSIRDLEGQLETTRHERDAVQRRSNQALGKLSTLLEAMTSARKESRGA